MGTAIEIKVNKKLLVNIILVILVFAAILEAVELGLMAYALKTEVFCK